MNTIPKPSEKCGRCTSLGVNCDCDCHVHAIMSGYHEFVTRGIPLNKRHGKVMSLINRIFRKKTEYI